MITKFRESASSYIEKVIKAAENSNFLKEKGFTNIKSTHSNEVTFVNSGDNVHAPSGDYITLRHATPELLKKYPSWNAWTASIKLNGITTSQIELKTEDGENLPLDGDVIESLIREIENIAPSNKDDSPNSFIITPTKAALKTLSEEMGEEQSGADYIATLNSSGQIPDDFEWDYSDNGDEMIVYNTTREAIEDWIFENFLWKDVIVKEVFKENYTKYHYKNHLFESGVNMNAKELIDYAQQYFGKATEYGNNGWLFTDSNSGRQAIVRISNEEGVIRCYSKRKGRDARYECGIDLNDTADIIRDTFIQKCKKAFSEGGRYQEYYESYSRAGRLFESEGFDVDDTVKELITFAHQYFGRGEEILDDTWLFTNFETGRSIIIRAIKGNINFYSKRKGRPGQFEDGMDINDLDGLLKDLIIKKIKFALSEGGRFKESVVRNTLVDRFISQY